MPPGIGYPRDIPIAREGGANGPQGSGKVGGLSPQEAVKILSLRVPERPSASAIAPLPLLTGAGGRAAGAQGLDALLQGLMQAFPQLPQPNGSGLGRGPNPQVPTFGGPGTPSQRGGGSQSAPSAPPPPRVTPGDEGRDTSGQIDPTSGGPAPPSSSPLDVTPPLPIAQPPGNPFARPGRNPRLAEKYFPDLDIQSLF